jgi:hypothetical protein
MVNLSCALQENGFANTTISLDDVSKLQLSIYNNGLPSDLIQTLQKLNVDRNAIEQFRQSIAKQDPNVIQGNYPQKFIEQPILNSLTTVAQILKK